MPLGDRGPSGGSHQSVAAVGPNAGGPAQATDDRGVRRALSYRAGAGRQYAVSRHTVREALRRLRDSGVLDSARGRGTWIAQQQPIEQPLGSLYSLFQEAGYQARRAA